MKKRAKIITIFLLLFLLGSCILDDLYRVMTRSYQSVIVVNNSDMDIAFYPYSLIPLGVYPDTLLPSTDIGFYSIRITAMSQQIYSPELDSEELRKCFNENDKLLFYLFSVDTLKKYTWDKIREGYKILKRYDLSIHDLDSINWTITYP